MRPGCPTTTRGDVVLTKPHVRADGLTPEMVEAIAADNERRALAADPEAPPVLAGGKVESAPAQVITSVPVATPVPVAAPAPAPAPAPPQSVGSKMKAKMKDLARETRGTWHVVVWGMQQLPVLPEAWGGCHQTWLWTRGRT